MAVVATINPTWKYKWMLVSVALFLWGGWCIYDYNIGYPGHDKIVEKFRQLQASGTMSEWPTIAAANGWSTDDPGEPHADSDYIAQISQLALFWPCSLLAGWWLVSHLGRTIAADEQGLIDPAGKKIPYGDITSIDKTRWRSKGIAYIHHGPPDDDDAVKFDDWLYVNIDKVLHEVEARTGITDSTTQTA